jgi:PAS domain S-box-containing protein
MFVSPLPVLEMMPCGIIIADAAGKIVFWNKADENMFGYGWEEVMGQSLTMLMPDRYKEAHAAGISRVVQKDGGSASKILGNSIKLFGRHKNGSEFELELYVVDYHWREDKHCFFAIVQELESKYLKIELDLLKSQLSNITPSVVALPVS